MDREHQPEPLPLDLSGQRPRAWCRLCRRPLAANASRRDRLGPDCRHKLYGPPIRRTDNHDVDQDTLPGT